MSYILEALKKSEHIRQQGRVPDLSSLQASEPLIARQAAAPRVPLLVGASVLLALALALAGWWRAWLAVPPPAAVTPAKAVVDYIAPAAQPAASSHAPANSAAPLAAAPLANSRSTPEAPRLQAPPDLNPDPSEAVPTAPAQQTMQPLPAPQSKSLPPLPSAAPAATNSAVKAPPVASEAPLPPAPNRVLAFHELPAALRARLPALKVSGFSYAEQAEQSLAVINDKVLRQGESPAPGLTVERIVSDGVVLSFAGYRFRPPR